MTRIDSRYSGQLRCHSQHGPSGSTLDTDAPTDLVATALSTCMLTIMGIVADRHGLNLEGTTARVEKTMTSEAPRRIAQLSVWVELPAGLEPQQRALLQRAAENCPVKLSLEGCVPMELHWS